HAGAPCPAQAAAGPGDSAGAGARPGALPTARRGDASRAGPRTRAGTGARAGPRRLERDAAEGYDLGRVQGRTGSRRTPGSMAKRLLLLLGLALALAAPAVAGDNYGDQ